MPSFQFRRFDFFDNIELFSSEDENDYFPFHLHDYFCVSLITNGTEILRTPEQEFLAPKGTISITQANEVHQNASLSGQGYSYKTIYCNPDLLRHFNNGQPVHALERVIVDNDLYRQLALLFDLRRPPLPENWGDTMKKLVTYVQNNPGPGRLFRSFDAIHELIAEHPAKPIDTGWLARQFCMSKFHFIREFKKSKGVSPQTYIMLQRLSNAREMLLQNRKPAEVAYLSGFSDQSHFTRSFRKYYGITPGHYFNGNMG